MRIIQSSKSRQSRGRSIKSAFKVQSWKAALIFPLFIIHYSLFIIPVYAQESSLRPAQIDPASPLYFLKSVRELLELKFAKTNDVKADYELKFATNRIAEVKSLALSSRQDLIQPTLEHYWSSLGQLIGRANLKDESIAAKVTQAAIMQMDILQAVYSQVSDPSAIRSIRTTVYRLSEWDLNLSQRLSLLKNYDLAQRITASKLSGCSFLSKEASSSALNQVEKFVLINRSKACWGN
ncbi:DUF5667 domain-containing protein [Patescibacteria group bacterium]|nr:DUF5667 domain-containing protein [Patescibacteria group bacterium]